MSLQLSPVESKHLTWLKNQRNRKEVMDFCRQPFFLNDINQDDWLKDCSRRRHMVPFIISDGDEWQGYAAFSNIDWVSQRAEFSAFMAPEFKGRGNFAEAIFLLLDYGFRRLNFHKIHSETFAFNKKEIELLKGLGFKESGKLVDHYFKRGKFHDGIIVYMLRTDFYSNYVQRVDKELATEQLMETKPL